MSPFEKNGNSKRLGSEWLRRRVSVIVDRPLGSKHPDIPGLVYCLNYGSIPGTTAGDGEPIDIYLVDAPRPLSSTVVFVIAIIHRHNDIEDKLVGSRNLRVITPEEVMEAVAFVERWFDITIETIAGKASYTRDPSTF